MVGAIIFDFDGVIADSEVLANTVLAEFVTELGVPTTVEDSYRDYMGKRLHEVVAAIEKLSSSYAEQLSAFSDADFRSQLDMFGQKASRGSHLVNLVVSGHAAYRTQLFCYLKACGRDELNTMNLWGGVDAPMQAAS